MIIIFNDQVVAFSQSDFRKDPGSASFGQDKRCRKTKSFFKQYRN